MPGLAGIMVTSGTPDINPSLTGMLQAIRENDWYKTDRIVDEQASVAIGKVDLGITNSKTANTQGGSASVSV
ncbi:MAG: hypothetical protein ACE5FQ_13580, partial [Thiogranum sp.]